MFRFRHKIWLFAKLFASKHLSLIWTNYSIQTIFNPNTYFANNFVLMVKDILPFDCFLCLNFQNSIQRILCKEINFIGEHVLIITDICYIW
jgi:hypothetical protein